MHEIEFTGIASSVQGTPATVTLEQHQSFLFTQSTWTVDGVTTGDALNLTKFDIEQNNGLDDDMQTEGLVNAGLVYGNLDFKVSFAVLFTVFSKVFQTYYGGAAGATDAQALGLGSLEVIFTQPDTLHTVKYKRSEEHTSELQSPCNLVCRLLLEKKKKIINYSFVHYVVAILTILLVCGSF